MAFCGLALVSCPVYLLKRDLLPAPFLPVPSGDDGGGELDETPRELLLLGGGPIAHRPREGGVLVAAGGGGECAPGGGEVEAAAARVGRRGAAGEETVGEGFGDEAAGGRGVDREVRGDRPDADLRIACRLAGRLDRLHDHDPREFDSAPGTVSRALALARTPEDATEVEEGTTGLIE